jgi:hypothetical protein
LTAHKELIEVLEHCFRDTSSDERLLLVSQAFKLFDQSTTKTAAAFVDVPLDIVKWMVSYSWNQGVQMYKQLDESEARAWLNVSIAMLRKAKEAANCKIA